MKNRLPNRLVALFAALVFLLSGAGDAYGLHVCSFHNPEGAAGHGDMGHASAAADTSHDHHHSDSPDESAEDGHGPCTCRGACPTSAVDTPRFDSAVTFAVHIVEAPAVAALGDVEPLARQTPYLLPYSQAPPANG